MERRTSFVTGSNRGIGQVIAEELAAKGHNIVVHSRKDTPEFSEYVTYLKEVHGIQVYKTIFDMTDLDVMKAEIKRLRNEGIEIDTLINCAGIAGGNLFAITPMREIRKVFEVNLFSYMEITQLLIRPMMQRKFGNIINIASFEGINLYPGNSAYGVSKAAVIAWTKTLAKEVGEFGVRVNAVAPGYVETDMTKNANKLEMKRVLEDSAIKRIANPKEIAQVVSFLVSDVASFITGEVIRVDGGMI